MPLIFIDIIEFLLMVLDYRWIVRAAGRPPVLRCGILPQPRSTTTAACRSVAILSGFGLLYQGLVELRAATERQHSALQAEMNAGFTDVREQLVDVRERLADVRERLVRVETVLDVESRDDPGGASPKGP